MIKVEELEVQGWRHAIRGARNAKNSWNKSDSCYINYVHADTLGKIDLAKKCGGIAPIIGDNDMKLLKGLDISGPDHRKAMRMIVAWFDITAPSFFWSEFDTYKVGTVRCSCSKMHTMHLMPLSIECFSFEGIEDATELERFEDTVKYCEALRQKFNEVRETDEEAAYKYWRALLETLPHGYNMKSTVMISYEVAIHMYKRRNKHKVHEWRELCEFFKNEFPYGKELIADEKIPY